MADQGLRRDQRARAHAENATMMRGAVRYRDGRMVIDIILHRERIHLRRAGFCPHRLTLQRDDGSCVHACLWMQDEPSLADYLNAANMLFNDEPGSLHWDALARAAVVGGEAERA